MTRYVHGYSPGETSRLEDQAGTLDDILHHDTAYPPGSRVLEPGCGTGAQTAILAARCPGAWITAVDISGDNLAAARERLGDMPSVTFVNADVVDLPWEDRSFDHAFVCFLLEHLAAPAVALSQIRRVVKPGGTITVIEGDHGSFTCHPETEAARKNVRCLVALQAAAGGDAMIGRRLYPLLTASGFTDVRVSPRMVYVDGSRPDLAEGFSRKTFIAMVAGVRDRAVAAGLIDPAAWDQGMADLRSAARPDGVFCYTFFKATGRIPGDDSPR